MLHQFCLPRFHPLRLSYEIPRTFLWPYLEYWASDHEAFERVESCSRCKRSSSSSQGRSSRDQPSVSLYESHSDMGNECDDIWTHDTNQKIGFSIIILCSKSVTILWIDRENESRTLRSALKIDIQECAVLTSAVKSSGSTQAAVYRIWLNSVGPPTMIIDAASQLLRNLVIMGNCDALTPLASFAFWTAVGTAYSVMKFPAFAREIRIKRWSLESIWQNQD